MLNAWAELKASDGTISAKIPPVELLRQHMLPAKSKWQHLVPEDSAFHKSKAKASASSGSSGSGSGGGNGSAKSASDSHATGSAHQPHSASPSAVASSSSNASGNGDIKTIRVLVTLEAGFDLDGDAGVPKNEVKTAYSCDSAMSAQQFLANRICASLRRQRADLEVQNAAGKELYFAPDQVLRDFSEDDGKSVKFVVKPITRTITVQRKSESDEELESASISVFASTKLRFAELQTRLVKQYPLQSGERIEWFLVVDGSEYAVENAVTTEVDSESDILARTRRVVHGSAAAAAS